MSTLLLRLSGPLQSWGVSSKFNHRSTGTEPSKSGVVGLLASALGRPRDDPVDDLTGLRFGVRVDQRGTVLRDYHTAHHPTDDKRAYVTNRYYLADATFLVGLEGERNLLDELDRAVRSPFYPLYLGRRSCPPAGRVSLGIRDSGLEEALRSEPWLASDWYARRQPPEVLLDLVMDSTDGGGYLQRDVPVSFSQKERRYATRGVGYASLAVAVENDRSRDLHIRATDHDPFAQLRGD